MSLSSLSFLKTNPVILSISCTQIILNSVVAAKISKVKTTKFDVRAYVAMTIVATIVALVSWLVIRLVTDISLIARIFIAVVLLGVLIEYFSHTVYVVKKLDNPNLRFLCILNLFFTICILNSLLIKTYKNPDSARTSPYEYDDKELSELGISLSQYFKSVQRHNERNEELTNKYNIYRKVYKNSELEQSINLIIDKVIKGDYSNDRHFIEQLESMVKSIQEYKPHYLPDQVSLLPTSQIQFIRKIYFFVTDIQDENKNENDDCNNYDNIKKFYDEYIFDYELPDMHMYPEQKMTSLDYFMAKFLKENLANTESERVKKLKILFKEKLKSFENRNRMIL